MSTKPELSQQIQQAIGLLNLRINDMMQQVNTTFKAFADENQRLQAKILELQCPVKEKQPIPKTSKP